MNLDLAYRRVQQLVGQRDAVVSRLEKQRTELAALKERDKATLEAVLIIQVVAQETQAQLCYHISELVTLALEAVFPRPYKLVLKFELRRNRTEADILLQDDEGNMVSPMDSVGGGVVDVAALALRVALWNLSGKSRPTLVLDEPLRFLSADLQPKAAEMLRQISKRLGLQMIIVTHEEELVSAGDAIFHVSIRKGISKIEKKGA